MPNNPPTTFLKAQGDTGDVHGSEGSWQAPRLSRALFKAAAGGSDDYRTKLEKALSLPTDKGGRPSVTLQEVDQKKWKLELQALCGHLLERLNGSLDEAWMSIYGYNPHSDDFKKLVVAARQAGKSVKDQVDTKNADLAPMAQFYDSGEEQWARAFSEMVVFAMYHSPNQIYGTPSDTKGDQVWYDRFPTVYSIGMACQHLSTYCCLSRGFVRAAGWTNGLSCAASSAQVKSAFAKSKIKPPETAATVRANLVSKGEMPKDPPTDPAAKAEEDAKIAAVLAKPKAQLKRPEFASIAKMLAEGAIPGSVAVFNEHGSASTDQTPFKPKVGVIHIASALRVLSNRIQFVDTGVVLGEGESPGVESGTFDHDFSTGDITEWDSLVALGVAKSVDDGTLISWAKKIADAKPLGVTRLVIATADTHRVLFVSKLLHMRWAVSKLIWSLRATGVPSGASKAFPFSGLTVAWLVWVPRVKASSEGLADALAGSKPDAPSKIVSGPLGLTHVIISRVSGEVGVLRSHKLSKWLNEAGKPAGAKPGSQGGELSWKLGDGDKADSLIPWCEKTENFGRCYIRTMAPTDAGNISESTMDHELVDP